ncbi:probable clathrin assembly protein At4g32285 [Actinidia eriantha]|uniref:probable clathrin assembly protein At4g32285 n=1 Tax=Actinidia eriantha TaxID=165200 RepID=UPI00258D00EA|nr:probable clathrin assembly protein At4g32285 [Actinidia eriantha]
MGSSTIRKAIGAVKDQTSISIAKVAGNVAPDLEVLVVKATSHDDEPADEKYIREILNLTSYSKGYVNAFVFAISKRLSKTRDWIVALKSLMLVHRLLSDGDPVLGQEIMYASRRGTRILNMSGFRDEARSNSWDHSGFVRTYAMYLDEKLEFMLYERKLSSVDRRGNLDRYGYGEFRDDQSYGMNRRSRSYGDLNESVEREQRKKETPVREMKAERVLERLHQLLRILDRFLACRPTGMAKNSRMVLVALYPVVKESFRLYTDVCEVLGVLLDRFSEMEYVDCVKSFDAYVNAAKMIDELVLFYGWCKEIGVARSSEYPEVQKITDKLLGSLEGYLRERANRPKSPEKARDDRSSAVKEEAIEDMNGIKALPPPENYTPMPPPPPPVPQPKPQPQHVTEDLVNLKDDVSAEDQSNKLTLALFSGLPAANSNSSWEAFNGESEVTSAWQTPAAESGKADWELALVESTSNLSKQKADLAGGFDPLLLNGMYDQGAVRQHVSNTQLTGGSASSVALPGTGKSATPILALPAPDGTVQNVGHQDPFAASLVVPPPAYVQIADMEKKQHLLVQEQQLWQQYGSSGMQGQVGLTKLAASYGMPPVTGMGQPGGYYTSY